jgi:glycosyltransferase involved in cell wall biosynthesis
MVAPGYYRRKLKSQGFELIVEDLNKVPLFTPLWTRTPLVLLVHHLFGRTAFDEASLPVATATWTLEKPLPLVYRRVPVEAVSDSTRQDLIARGFAGDDIAVIPNGVDLGFYRPDPAVARFETPTVLYLGRLKKYKGVDLIIRAVARLVTEGTPVRLIIAGKGDYADELTGLISELGIQAQVEMRGFVDEEAKRTLFRRTWIHSLTSPKEGWGISNLEAAACGTPTVASDSPGLRDSVADGETGFLVPHGDVDALAACFRRVLGDPALRDRLGAGALRFAATYSWDAAADRTEAHLDKVLSRRRGGERIF